ncbi:hypothetical protein Tco_0584941 [Tanacetum coccineum]
MLGRVENITFGGHFSELLSRLKDGSYMSNDDRAENGDREEQIASRRAMDFQDEYRSIGEWQGTIRMEDGKPKLGE